MAIWLTKDSRVIVAGVTGSEGSKHTRRMLRAGTNIVAELHLNTLGSGTITILGASGQVLDDATEASGRIARVTYQAREPGSYFIRLLLWMSLNNR